ncbi:hypothetical protein [Olsenella sp. Marseille-P4559]|jgi:hypothetical protein|nr:hypothetical protein [Olsenella sp. Marseille-P4559]
MAPVVLLIILAPLGIFAIFTIVEALPLLAAELLMLCFLVLVS